MKILITNDDGIHSPGIKILYNAMTTLGEVLVVAPDREQSACGHSISLEHTLRLKNPREHWYSLDGTPCDCVYFANCHLLETKADLVISGINKGPNMAQDVIYSGTVAGAAEGTMMGIPSIAISLTETKNPDFSYAATVATRIAAKVLSEGLPEGILLNVNVPSVPAREPKFKITRLGIRHYGREVIKCEDPRGKPYYWLGGAAVNFTSLEGSDCNANNQGHITITPLKLDWTDHPMIETLKTWSF